MKVTSSQPTSSVFQQEVQVTFTAAELSLIMLILGGTSEDHVNACKLKFTDALIGCIDIAKTEGDLWYTYSKVKEIVKKIKPVFTPIVVTYETPEEFELATVSIKDISSQDIQCNKYTTDNSYLGDNSFDLSCDMYEKMQEVLLKI
jgi:hypothetical protein